MFLAPYSGISLDTGEPWRVISARLRKGSLSVPTMKLPPETKM